MGNLRMPRSPPPLLQTFVASLSGYCCKTFVAGLCVEYCSLQQACRGEGLSQDAPFLPFLLQALSPKGHLGLLQTRCFGDPATNVYVVFWPPANTCIAWQLAPHVSKLNQVYSKNKHTYRHRYIYIHIYTCIYIYIYWYAHIFICTHVHMYIYIHMYIICANTSIYIDVFITLCIYVYMYICIYVCICLYIYT